MYAVPLFLFLLGPNLNNFRPKSHRHLEGRFIRIDQGSLPDKISLGRLNEFCFLSKLLTEKGDRCNKYHGITSEEATDGKVARQECAVSVAADNACRERGRDIGAIGLEPATVGRCWAIDTLCFTSSVEENGRN